MATKFITPSWRMPKNSNQSKASNYSIDFDGTTQFIDLGNTVEILPGQPNPSGAQNISNPEWSVSCFVNFSALGAQSCIVSTGRGGGSTYFEIRKSTSDKIEGYFRTSSGGYTTITGDTTITSGTWYHVCIAWNNGNLNLYLNGVSDCDAVSATNFYFAGDGFLPLSTIGRFRYGTGGSQGRDQFDGKLDHVAIFNYGLDSNAVTTLWGGGIPGNPLAIKPPIAYYNLGQGSAYAEGSAGIVEPNLAAATGSTVFNFDNTATTPAPSFDTSFNPDGYTKLTFSVWAYIDSYHNKNTFLASFGAAPNKYSDNNFRILTNSNVLSITMAGNTVGNVNVGNAFLSITPNDVWNLITIVYDGTFTDADTATQNAGRLKFYTNGVYKEFDTFTNDVPSSIISTTSIGTRIGARNPTLANGSLRAPLYGKLSNAQIWNESLTLSEVETLYNNGTPLQSNIPQSGNLKAWYKLNLEDSFYSSILSKWLIPTSANPTLTSKSCYEFLRNGNGKLGSSSLIGRSNESTFTISYWINPTTSINDLYWIGINGHFYYNSGGGVFRIYQSSTNLKLIHTTTNSYSGNMQISKANAGFESNKWVHHTWTFNAGSWKIFVNGVDKTTDLTQNNIPSTMPYMTSGGYTNVSAIGGYWAPTTNTTGNNSDMQCWMSNVALWNTDQSSNISTIYNGGVPGDISSLSPNNWWKLEGDVIDYGSSGNNLLDNLSTYYNPAFPANLPVTTGEMGESSGMDTTNLVPSNLQKSIPYSGYSMEFDNASGTYITTGLTIAADSNFSVSFWVKGGTSPGTKYPGIFPFGIGNASNGTLGRMHPSGVYKFMVQSYDNTGANFGNRIIDIDIWDGSWYHILFTRDNTSGQVFAYVNGTNIEWGSAFGSNAAPSITGNPSGDLYIGTAGGNASYTFDGFVSNLAIFNRVLTQDEILRAYNGGSPGDLTNLNPDSWWSLGADSYFNGSDWICPDLGSSTNNGTSDSMGVGNLLGSGPNSLANGTSTNLDLSTDLIGEAPGSTGNAISINMNSLARTGSTP